jgi:hypothetical protein
LPVERQPFARDPGSFLGSDRKREHRPIHFFASGPDGFAGLQSDEPRKLFLANANALRNLAQDSLALETGHFAGNLKGLLSGLHGGFRVRGRSLKAGAYH